MDDLTSLVSPMIPALRRYARSLVKNAAEADDLVQDCLERTISRWHQRRAEGDARTWVFAICHNLAINHLTRSGRRRAVPLDDVEESVVSQRPDQEDGMRHSDVLAALDRLPDEQRTVLLLVSVEDMSYAQAAEVIGVPIGTVMSRLSRARERLRRNIGEAAPAAAPVLRRVK